MKLWLRKIGSYPAPVRLGVFLLTLLLVWLPIATPIYWFFSGDPNLVAIATMGLLFVQFLLLQRFWGKYIYRQPKILQQYGLIWTSKNGIELLNGLAIGFCFCWGLFICEAILGWVKFNSPSISLVRIIAEGLLSALGIGLAEELVFRGWILKELERDYAKQIVLWTNALIFALAHFIKPLEEIIRIWVTFPALIILGLTLVWAKWGYRDRLGICIGLHAGLVWGYYILNVGQLFEYAGKVPTWITGIDGNPLAGLMGLTCLSIIAWWMSRKAILLH